MSTRWLVSLAYCHLAPWFWIEVYPITKGLITGLVNLLIIPTAIGKISALSHHWAINNACPTYINDSFHRSSIYFVHSYSWLAENNLAWFSRTCLPDGLTLDTHVSTSLTFYHFVTKSAKFSHTKLPKCYLFPVFFRSPPPN